MKRIIGIITSACWLVVVGCDGEDVNPDASPPTEIADALVFDGGDSADATHPADASSCSSDPMRLYDATGVLIGPVANLGEYSVRVLLANFYEGDRVLEFWLDSGRIPPMGDVFYTSDDCSGVPHKHWPEPADINPPAVLSETYIKDCYAQQICRISPEDAQTSPVDFLSRQGASMECLEPGLYTTGVEDSFRVSEVPTQFGYPLALPLEIRVGCDSFTLD